MSLLVGFSIGILLLSILASWMGKRSSEESNVSAEVRNSNGYRDHRRSSFYRTRSSVMDMREQAFFFELKKQLPPDMSVFPKMRIADIVETTNGKGYRRQLYKILPKHVDFLITDRSFRPRFAVELNGSSHARFDRAESDSLKQAIFADVGLELYIVQVGREFASEIGRILSEQAVLNKA